VILDRWGNSYKAAQGAITETRDRPYIPVQMKDISELVPARDRKALVSFSRRLILNEGVLKGAIEQKSMYSVGRSWQAQSKSKDREFALLAEEKINDEWQKICDVAGGQNNFQTLLYSFSVAISRDGEGFILLTKTENDYPRVQQIPSHRISTPNGLRDGKLTTGKFKGRNLVDGIVYRNGAPVAYCYVDQNNDLIEYFDAQNIIHSFDPSWQEQGRGLPAFTHALNDLRDALQSHEWERHAQLMLSQIVMSEHNETGLAPDDNASIITGDDTTCQGPIGANGIISDTLGGGQVRYFAAKSGAKLDILKNDRPGESWESFQNRIYRKALSGDNWPLSMCWTATGQGTAERADLGRAQRAVEDRQDLLEYAANRMTGYAVAKLIKLGELPAANDWWKWKFTYPKKLTIDDGRVSKELIEQWKAGFLNTQDVLGYLGKSEDEHLDQRINYLVKMKTKVLEANKANPEITIEPREMQMLTANDMGQPIEPLKEKEDDLSKD
jgi:hypothetical protein